MAGGEYEPNDSRNVTLRPNAPGKPNGWRADDAKDGVSSELAPEDMRDVTEEGIPEPGTKTGWREKQAGAERSDAAKTPPGVPQEGRPFTAGEAAEAGDLDR